MSNTPYADLLLAVGTLEPTDAKTLIPYMEQYDVGQLETREMIQLAFERGAIVLGKDMRISLAHSSHRGKAGMKLTGPFYWIGNSDLTIVKQADNPDSFLFAMSKRQHGTRLIENTMKVVEMLNAGLAALQEGKE